MKYTNITTIVSEIHGRLQDNNDKLLELYTHYVIEAVRDLNIFHSRSVKTIQFTPDETNGITLPSDYIAYTAISINMCGRRWTLTQNDDILPTTATRCNIPIRGILSGCCEGDNPEIAIPSNGFNFMGYWNNGVWNAPAYGIGGGFNRAYFNVDEFNNRINFNGVIPKNRGILQYLTDGIDLCGESVVPMKYKAAIRALAEWQFKLHDTQVGIGEKQLFKQESNEAMARMENLEFSFTLAEFIDGSRETLKQTVKR